MDFKQNPLTQSIQDLYSQSTLLAKARHAFLLKDAEKSHWDARMINANPGKSYAEKSNNAKASEEWLSFHKELAKLESLFEFEKLKFSIMERDWQSQYLAMKLDESLIKKQE